MNLGEPNTFTTAVIAPDTPDTSSHLDGIPFGGVFDGDGYVIRNLAIDTADIDNDYIGLCGGINGSSAEVKNLGLENVNITGGGDSHLLGGLCGWNNRGTITYCYSCASIDGWSVLGGLCGSSDGTITNCFWDVITSEIGSPGDDNYGATGKITEQMQTESTFTAAGWDFVGEKANGTEDHWQLCNDGIDYPRLTWQFINPADFLHPGRVDLYDLFTLTHDWLTSNSRCCDIAPILNPDGIVNLFDYIELSRYWLNE